ncbi:hypothetical protein CEXT_814591 [Caerostris extrusa]|uniref:Uncharacterized protein n=1 Tax=Caerostris extrusa TaxID=172846 RepID=A0AAV4PEH1_CAEEX|nr:hypothetical protein CEXT_814591 [Caerostris extrusa]
MEKQIEIVKIHYKNGENFVEIVCSVTEDPHFKFKRFAIGCIHSQFALDFAQRSWSKALQKPFDTITSQQTMNNSGCSLIVLHNLTPLDFWGYLKYKAYPNAPAENLPKTISEQKFVI